LRLAAEDETSLRREIAEQERLINEGKPSSLDAVSTKKHRS
jgi:hypothetical protein